MVYYFTSNVSDEPVTLYMGKDKFENEELLKFGWDSDVWFHVDALSSAHVYLRIPLVSNSFSSSTVSNNLKWTWEALPQSILEDCAQLTKANSIEGNKKNDLSITYTPLSNLRKTSSMATGQVGFHSPTHTRTLRIASRDNATINRLEKTRKVESVDELAAKKEVYLTEQRARKRKEAEHIRRGEEKVRDERRREREGKEADWEALRSGSGGRSNEAGFDEDDFM